jgi:aldehyde dehydrogenase (NAD+)
MDIRIKARHADAARQLPKVRLLIGSRHQEAGSAGAHRPVNPTTGESLSEIPLAGVVEVDEAVRAARQALGAWRNTRALVRRDIILRLAALVERETEAFGTITALESGVLRDVFTAGHMPLVLEWFRYYAGWADKIEGTVVGSQPGQDFGMILREPFGVFAMVIPWNSPLLSLAMKVPAALASGNTMVIKPPEITPFAAARFGELAQEAGVPAGVLNIIPGDAAAGRALVRHPGIDKISFTGSPATAQRIIAAAAANMTPGLYELGGKSANIVFPDAPDLEAIASYSTAYAFTNAGQGCTCPTRIIAHADIYDELLRRVLKCRANLTVGDPLDKATGMGPVITAAARERIESMMARARTENPRASVHGGERLNGKLAGGFFLSPAVFAGVDRSSEIAQEEVFGPVLAIIKFNAEREAIEIANDTSYGLAAYVQTNDLKRAMRCVRDLRAGSVYINRSYTMSNPGNTTGGVGMSGYGREGGLPGLEEYLRTKGVSIDWS